MSKADKVNIQAAALFGRLRELAARVQSFRDVVLDLSQDIADPVNSVSQESIKEARFQEALPCTNLNRTHIDSLITDIYAIFQKDGRAYSAYGDSLGRIQVAWDRVKEGWSRAVVAKGRDCSRQFSRIAIDLDSIVSDSCEITIPARIRDHLKLLPIGGVLDFKGAYFKELSTPEGRRRFLTYLKFYPDFIDGLIDIDNEAIIRAAPSRWRRISTIFIAGAIALAGFLLILIACWIGTFANLSGWPFRIDRVKDYCLAYFFLIIGSMVHVIVTLLKQDRSASRSDRALSDWILRIHVRETAFYISSLSICCGALAMPFLIAREIPWQTAFFVGYSYDSFVDLFLRRFEGAVSSSTVKIKEASS